ncbi:anthranilate synthase [Amanita rubescens]|nr:anthranilate synthase [Amanita rubescens]
MTAMTLPSALAGQLDVLLIDNFDSFTWNLYQQLCLLGADVTVIRNDAISPSLFAQLKIRSLVISPGPGHPQTDSGISKDAIAFFTGKVPVLGVCMGLECLVDLYCYAGEIMHGKVSKIRHDNRGCFKSDSGVIMGVRHRKYTLEAVQYHPESILSEGGNDLIRNFLSLRGGIWDENPEFRVQDASLPPFPVEALPKDISSKPETTAKIPSILEKIHSQRLQDVAKARTTPGSTLQDLETLHKLNIAPPLISFASRIKETTPGRPALFAEIKRASPSKGPISLSTNPASQALTYALAGAHVISVLTEPKWFMGNLQDMLHARQAIANLPNHTVLLIVSMLPETLLRELYKYCLELNMEPLVEVNNAREMDIALALPAKIIGVNNRNLHDFNVDMNTTSRLSDMAKDKNVTLCALSGISTADDVKRYTAEGIGAVLIGESLMRSRDVAGYVRELFSIPDVPSSIPYWRTKRPLVKVCGIRSESEAVAIAEAGADMLGLILVPDSKRRISLERARDISSAIRSLRASTEHEPSPPEPALGESTPWLTMHANKLTSSLIRVSRPLVVGVFQDASLDQVLDAVAYAQLDMVQLHGSEPTEWAKKIPVPVIRAFHVSREDANVAGRGLRDITRGGEHQHVLLDSVREDGSGKSGGSGKVLDLDLVREIVETGEVPIGDAATPSGPAVDGANGDGATSPRMTYPLPVILAGGLKSSNIVDAIARVKPWAVDVSGGVEADNGQSKDLEKVRLFIDAVKGGSE